MKYNLYSCYKRKSLEHYEIQKVKFYNDNGKKTLKKMLRLLDVITTRNYVKKM